MGRRELAEVAHRHLLAAFNLGGHQLPGEKVSVEDNDAVGGARRWSVWAVLTHSRTRNA